MLNPLSERLFSAAWYIVKGTPRFAPTRPMRLIQNFVFLLSVSKKIFFVLKLTNLLYISKLYIIFALYLI